MTIQPVNVGILKTFPGYYFRDVRVRPLIVSSGTYCAVSFFDHLFSFLNEPNGAFPRSEPRLRAATSSRQRIQL